MILNWLFRLQESDDFNDCMMDTMSADLSIDNSPASKATDRLVAGSTDWTSESRLKKIAKLAGSGH